MVPKAPFGERITIQNKCYEVIGLHRWIIEMNNKKLPSTQTNITSKDRYRLIEAYDDLVPNILTRNKLIQLYPNLQQETEINLSKKKKKYTDIDLGTFSKDIFSDDLPNLRLLDLNNNRIQELQPGIFDNLQNLKKLFLNNNRISVLHHDTFYNLQLLQELHLDNNQIRELQSLRLPSEGIFNNLPELQVLYLNNNQIIEIQSGIFNNLPRLERLFLNNNQIIEIQPGTFNNLPRLEKLFLNNNQIRELQPGTFNNLPRLEKLWLNNNQIRELQPNSYYGLFTSVHIKIFNYDLDDY